LTRLYLPRECPNINAPAKSGGIQPILKNAFYCTVICAERIFKQMTLSLFLLSFLTPYITTTENIKVLFGFFGSVF